MTLGPQPRWPTTCSWAGMTTMRLLGCCAPIDARLSGGSWGSPSAVNQSIGMSVTTGAPSFAGTTPFGRYRHRVAYHSASTSCAAVA